MNRVKYYKDISDTMSIIRSAMESALEERGFNERQIEEYLGSKHVRWAQDGFDNPDQTVTQYVDEYFSKSDPEQDLRKWGVWDEPEYNGPDFGMDSAEGNNAVREAMERIEQRVKVELGTLKRFYPATKERAVREAMAAYIDLQGWF